MQSWLVTAGIFAAVLFLYDRGMIPMTNAAAAKKALEGEK